MKSLLIALPLLLGRSVEVARSHHDQLAVPANRIGHLSTSECCSVAIAVDSVLSDSMSSPEKGGSPGELVIRVGNESNQVDGVFGPFTYGLRGAYAFTNGMGIEAVFTRLHEPGSPAFNSFLDEGQLTLRFPETTVLEQPLAFAATLWSNRMIDMYTDVGGIEMTRKGESLSFNGGLYTGDARRDDVNGRFFAFLIGASTTIGPVEVALTQMSGAIRTAGDPSGLGDGRYSRTAIEGNMEINLTHHFPMILTLGLERRYFNFGNGGPVSDPRDGYILVLGVESDIVDFFVSAK